MKINTNPKYLGPDGKFSQVRYNLLEREGYSPYCGNNRCMNRIDFDGEQFNCDDGYRTYFPDEFINTYKTKWGM